MKRATQEGQVISEDDISVDLEDEDGEVEDDLDTLFASAPAQAKVPTRTGSVSPLFPTRDLEPEAEAEDSSSSSRQSSASDSSRSASPLFPGRDDRSASPLFPERTQGAASSRSASPATSQRSASPLFPVRQAKTVSVPQPVVKKTAAPAVAPFDEALVALARQERLAGLGVLSGLFDDDRVEVDADAGETRKGKSEWKGFEESDDEEELQGVLRLRGGAGSSDDEDSESEDESSDASSDDDSSDSSDDSSEEDSSEEESSEDESKSMDVDDAETSKTSKLKDMFAPRPEQSESCLFPSSQADHASLCVFADAGHGCRVGR